MQVSFQTRDADGNVHGDPDAINVHVSTGALIMLVLGYPAPKAECDVVGTNVDPADVRDRCAMFEWVAEAGLVRDKPGIHVGRLLRRVRQVRALAEQAIVDGHRLTWA